MCIRDRTGSMSVEEMVCAATGHLDKSTTATTARQITALNPEIRAVELTEKNFIESTNAAKFLILITYLTTSGETPTAQYSIGSSNHKLRPNCHSP